MQIGSIGLIKAIDKFDLSFEVRFSTYAVPMIGGEIKRFLRDDGMIKVSRSLKENALKVFTARERLEKRLGREPAMQELSEETGLSGEDIVMAIESATEVDSIYRTIYQGDGNAISLADRLEEKDNPNERLLDHMVLQEVMATLEEREKRLIEMRYFEEKTQNQVAAALVDDPGPGLPDGKKDTEKNAGKVFLIPRIFFASERHNNLQKGGALHERDRLSED